MQQETETQETETIYVQVGGDPAFKRLVDIFYSLIENDPLLRPLFPADLEPGKRWQFLFLTQLFGGPARYGQERGQPRLRLRHMPYAIDRRVRDRWLAHMLTAVDQVGIPEPARTKMREYFERSSRFMVNVESDLLEQS